MDSVGDSKSITGTMTTGQSCTVRVQTKCGFPSTNVQLDDKANGTFIVTSIDGTSSDIKQAQGNSSNSTSSGTGQMGPPPSNSTSSSSSSLTIPKNAPI